MSSAPSWPTAADAPARSTRLADALAPEVEALADTLLIQMRDAGALPAAWSIQDLDRVRAGLIELLESFVTYLQLGDIEATTLEALRRRAAGPLLPPAEGTVLAIARAHRLRFVDAVAHRIRATLRETDVRVLERATEEFLALLGEPGASTDDPADLDAWLERVRAEGVDAE